MNKSNYVSVMQVNEDNTATITHWQVSEKLLQVFRDIMQKGSGSDGNTAFITDVTATTDFLTDMPATIQL